MTNAALDGKPYSGNPHVRIDEGDGASAKPRRSSLLYRWILGLLVALVHGPILGASVDWSGVRRTGCTQESVDPLVTITDVNGSVRAADGAAAAVTGMIFTQTTSDGSRVKAYDYSHTAAPVNTKWLLALCGDVLDASTLFSFRAVELTESYDFGTGGDRIATPSDFYLVFVAEDWDDYVSHAENPHRWYGWVNLAVNADGALDVLGSDIAVYGDRLVVGGGSATPEPSGALLLLLGLGALGLRRPRSTFHATSLRTGPK